jgi:hypothetical protein
MNDEEPLTTLGMPETWRRQTEPPKKTHKKTENNTRQHRQPKRRGTQIPSKNWQWTHVFL